MNKFILLIILAANITSCTSIGFRCNTLPVGSVEQQKCLANGGNKNAQYQLGLDAYNDENDKTALRWLEMAAKPISSYQSIYLPPVGGQKYGTVMLLKNGIGSAGHMKARALIERIRKNENNEKNN